MVIVRYVFGAFPDYVCVEVNKLYYKVEAKYLTKSDVEGYYLVDAVYLVDGSPTLRYDF